MISLFCNKTVRKKLNNVFFVSGILLCVGTLVTILCIAVAASCYHTLYQNAQYLDRPSADFAVASRRADQSTAKMAAASGDCKAVKDGYNEVLNFQNMMSDNLDTISKADVDTKTADDIQSVEANQAILANAAEDIYNLSKAGKSAEAEAYYKSNYSMVAEDVQQKINEIHANAERIAADDAAEANSLRYAGYGLAVVILLCMLLISYGIHRKLQRSIMEPLCELNEVSKELSNGNLGTIVCYRGMDEFGMLAGKLRIIDSFLADYIKEIEAFAASVSQGNYHYTPAIMFKGKFCSIKRAMDVIESSTSMAIQQVNNNTKQTMQQINGSADAILHEMEMLVDIGKTMGQSSAQQAGLVTELTAAIDAVSKQMKNNASRIQNASMCNDRIQQTLAAGSADLNSMGDRRYVMQDMVDDMAKITKNMKDIALRADMLSINAAAEVRSGNGEAGCITIAKQIHNLAVSASEASTKTDVLIKNVAASVHDNTAWTKEWTQEAIEKLAQIDNNVKDASDMLHTIYSAMQDVSVVQMQEIVNKISDVIDENTAMAEDTAASGEGMAEKMEALRQLVKSFKVK